MGIFYLKIIWVNKMKNLSVFLLCFTANYNSNLNCGDKEPQQQVDVSFVKCSKECSSNSCNLPLCYLHSLQSFSVSNDSTKSEIKETVKKELNSYGYDISKNKLVVNKFDKRYLVQVVRNFLRKIK